MASHLTRAERAGNIFYRVTGLIRSGQLSWNERPLWYDVMAALPPLSSPDWNAKLAKHDEPVRKIWYQEDEHRAHMHKTERHQDIVNALRSPLIEERIQGIKK